MEGASWANLIMKVYSLDIHIFINLFTHLMLNIFFLWVMGININWVTHQPNVPLSAGTQKFGHVNLDRGRASPWLFRELNSIESQLYIFWGSIILGHWSFMPCLDPSLK